MHNQVTLDLRKAGIISFAVGVIMFFGQGYLGDGFLFLSNSFAQQEEVAINVISGAFLTVWSGAFVLILAGAVMFFVGRGKLKASPSAAN